MGLKEKMRGRTIELWGVAIFMVVVVVVGIYYFYQTTLKELASEKKQLVTREDLGENFYGIDFTDAKNGWTVGERGAIFNTKDGGKNWEKQQSGVESILVAVDFFDPQTGWTVGRFGVILHTSDGGKQWQSQHSNTRVYLLDIHFVNSRQGWAVGERKTILYTKDGGKNWHLQSQEEETVDYEVPRLNRVNFLNAGQGWTVGEFGTILSTKDGGKTWKNQKSGVGINLLGVAFRNSLEGMVVGIEGTTLYTRDGGKTWTRMDAGAKKHLFSVTPAGKFRGVNEWWAAGQGSLVFLYLEEGVVGYSGKWSFPWSLPQEANIPYKDINVIRSFATQEGEIIWAVGESGLIMKCFEGGEWKIVALSK